MCVCRGVAYVRDKNTSARLSIKNKESGYLQKLEITHVAAVIELIWKQEQVFKLCCLG